MIIPFITMLLFSSVPQAGLNLFDLCNQVSDVSGLVIPEKPESSHTSGFPGFRLSPE